jgi:hypothetical protein
LEASTRTKQSTPCAGRCIIIHIFQKSVKEITAKESVRNK